MTPQTRNALDFAVIPQNEKEAVTSGIICPFFFGKGQLIQDI